MAGGDGENTQKGQGLMEFITLIQSYGIIGLFMLMVFQYVVRPLVAAYIGRRNNNSNPNLAQRIKEVHEILIAKDDRYRPLVYGDDIKEAIEKLTEAMKDLTEEIKS